MQLKMQKKKCSFRHATLKRRCKYEKYMTFWHDCAFHRKQLQADHGVVKYYRGGRSVDQVAACVSCWQQIVNKK